MILISLCNKEKKEKFACCILSHDMRKPVFPTEHQGFQTGPTQIRLAAIEDGLSFWIMIEEGIYYPCSENKEADLHLCFRICKKLVFLLRGSFKSL